jgi:4'-phosphopantetheinyl transferase
MDPRTTETAAHDDGAAELPPVRVWLSRLDDVDAAQADRISLAKARKLAAGAATRARLAAELPGVDLAAMRRGRNGKPYLPAPFAHVGFNPSDSGGWFLIGLVEGADIGVDLEVRQPRPKALAVARRHFPQPEVAWLQRQDDTDHAFLRLWTMKEALFKSIGRGLGYGLANACFQPDGEGRLRLVELRGEAAPASRWSVCELDVGPGLVAAAVWSGPPRTVTISVQG